MKKSDSHGFSLMEMLIVVAIVAILTAVALPSFLDSIRKARRSDAGDSLLYIQSLQEKYRANHTTFGTIVEIGYDTGSAPYPSNEGFYNMTVTVGSAVAYTITATATGGQLNDTSNPVDCTSLTIVVSATDPRGTKNPAACWSN